MKGNSRQVTGPPRTHLMPVPRTGPSKSIPGIPQNLPLGLCASPTAQLRLTWLCPALPSKKEGHLPVRSLHILVHPVLSGFWWSLAANKAP